MQIDGQPPTENDLAYLALVNYGAYTSFRVEGGGVRGLDLHLARLAASAEELFGEAVDEARLRDRMRQALAGQSDAWLRIGLFSPDVWARTPSARGAPRVMTTVSPPPPPLASRLRVQIQTYAREAAHLKHTATFGLIRARRRAREAGYDDALFADAEGWISEGSLWNIGFITGDTVVWPQAPMLAGVAQALIDRGLGGQAMTSVTRPVAVHELANFDAAFICNSATPCCPIGAIEDVPFTLQDDAIAAVARAWASAPAQPI